MNDIFEHLQILTQKIRDTVSLNKDKLKSKSASEFVENDVKSLGTLIGAYSNFFTSIDCTSRGEAERLWTKALLVDKSLEKQVEMLLDEEDAFDLFLTEIDRKLDEENGLDKATDEIVVNDCAPEDEIPLLNGMSTTLKRLVEGFNSEMAKRWYNETDCIYPIIYDTNRTLYKKFHLGSSIKHTWDIKAQTWYAEQKCLGRKLHPMAENDDPHQLGGNMIIDGNGVLKLVYRSQYPLDRPDVDTLLSCISCISPDQNRNE